MQFYKFGPKFGATPIKIGGPENPQFQSIFHFAGLLGSHTYSVRAFCFGRRVCRLSVVCLSRVRSRKLREIRAKFRHLYRKRGRRARI